MIRYNLFVREILADMDTPVSAYAKLCLREPDSFLLESAENHEQIGRWSIIAFDPIMSIELWPDRTVVTDETGRAGHRPEDFFPLVRNTVESLSMEHTSDLPAVGSLMGFVGYDAVRLLEPIGPIPKQNLPIARLVLPSRFLLFDQLRRVLVVAVLAADADSARRKADDVLGRLSGTFVPARGRTTLTLKEPDRDRYMAAVERAKEYIRAGDVFQVVLADRYEGRASVEPMEVYRRLRVKNPSPYMFYLNFGDYRILGASPETLVRTSGGKVFLRPIAGTRGRSADPEEDRRLEEELASSEKERAEHVMLVDLGRNDVGRVSRFGSVAVSPYMAVERYSHVMHLVSQVQGTLREDCGPVEAFTAGFPAGTVSGAPKVRAMQIIDELEYRHRGPYSGAVGYFGPGGRMDTCIAIRMLLFQGDAVSIPVGAGIVADSEPEMEFMEIEKKAAGSLAALRAAVEGE